MSTFKEIIESKTPILIEFYEGGNETSTSISETVKEIELEAGDTIKVIKIDTFKNPELVEALRIKHTPTLMIYVGGVMAWRHSGEMEKESIVEILKEQIQWQNSQS
jgi:thioredoxin 1